MIKIEVEGHASRAEIVEAAFWTFFCVSGVGIGIAMVEWSNLFTHIAVAYGMVYLVLATWVVRRKRTRADTRIWL